VGDGLTATASGKVLETIASGTVPRSLVALVGYAGWRRGSSKTNPHGSWLRSTWHLRWYSRPSAKMRGLPPTVASVRPPSPSRLALSAPLRAAVVAPRAADQRTKTQRGPAR